MIFEGVVQLICSMVTTMLSVLPDVNAGTWQLGGLSTIVSKAKGFDAYFPVHETLIAVGFILAYVGISFAYRGINWVWRHVPVVGGG